MTAPPNPPADRAADRRATELVIALIALPLLAHLAQRLWLGHLAVQGWATSKGALAMSLGPTLFGAGMLFLTRMYWAAWMAWAIDLLVLGLLAAGDVIVQHAVSPRLVLAAVGLPLLAWRIAGLQRLQVKPRASADG